MNAAAGSCVVRVLVVLCVLALLASGAAALAVGQRGAAQRQRDTAIFNQITAQAERLRSIDVSLAVQLQLTAYRMRPTPDLATALITAGDAVLSTPLTGHTDNVYAVAFSPDGHTLATGSADHTVRLWNVTTPTHPTPLGPPLIGHTDTVRTVASARMGALWPAVATTGRCGCGTWLIPLIPLRWAQP